MTAVDEPAYWIIVSSPDNFSRSREIGFTMQGFKFRHRKKAERMKPGDKIVYYLTGLKAFGGISTITAPYYESHDRIWASGDPKKEAEDYPYRVQTSLDLILNDGEYASAEPIARQMAYVAKSPAANWTLAFQGNVHEVSEGDFEPIRAALSKQ